MKLYRGIKSFEFSFFKKTAAKKNLERWQQLLKIRGQGDFRYPEKFEEAIQDLFVASRLQRQNFSDNKEIAASYARSVKGILVSIDVPRAEILKYFDIEFQNFARRKKRFELVYVVNHQTLTKKAKAWNIRVDKVT